MGKCSTIGWEEIKGKKYFYHKISIGLRVQSFYLGNSIQTYMYYAIME